MHRGLATYTNHNGEIIELSGGAWFCLQEGAEPNGIYGVPTEPVFASIPRKVPVGVYQANNMIRRRIELPLLAYGCDRGELITRFKALWDVLYVDIRDDYQGVFAYTAWNLVEKRILCAALGESNGIDTWLSAAARRESGAEFMVILDCADPTFYYPTENEETGNFAGAGNVNIACTNAGNTDGYPTILWEADDGNTIENPQVTDAHGNVLQIENTIAIGQGVTIVADPQNISITYDLGPADWFGQRSSGSEMPLVAPGTNNLVFTNDNAAATGSITVNWYDRDGMHG